MPDINRNIEAKIKILLKMFPVVAIIGVRQCGKTTLAQKICPVWKYVDMESARDYELISSDPNFFFSQYSDHVYKAICERT